MNPDLFIILQGAADNVGTKNNWSTFPTIGQFFYYLFACAIVIFGAYYVTKWMSKSRVGKKGSNVRIIESVPVGNQCSVQLCKVGEKYLLIGVSKEGVRMLVEVDPEQISPPETFGGYKAKAPFEKYLRQFMKTRAAEEKGDDGDDDAPASDN